jgi:hypothetical protein
MLARFARNAHPPAALSEAFAHATRVQAFLMSANRPVTVARLVCFAWESNCQREDVLFEDTCDAELSEK